VALFVSSHPILGGGKAMGVAEEVVCVLAEDFAI